MTDEKVLTEPRIRSVIGFGSRARGDSDSISDNDICVFTTDISYHELIALRTDSAAFANTSVEDVAIYPTATVEAMAQKGSLLLWHLALEGKIIVDRDSFAVGILGRLRKFNDYEHELQQLEAVLAGVKTALCAGDLSPFDLHVLFVVVRNTCIALAYKGGEPAFGRYSAFAWTIKQHKGFPVCRSDYDELAYWHLKYTRGVGILRQLPKIQRFCELCEAVERGLSYAREALA